MWQNGDISPALRLAMFVVPVAIYFGVLGVLNSRRRPQLLSARADFALLTGILCPLLIIPVVQWLGSWALAPVLGAVGVFALLGVPPRHNWVVYNLSTRRARRVIAEALRDCGIDWDGQTEWLTSPSGGQTRLEIGGFPLLRNVSVRLRGADDALAGRFQGALSYRLASVETEVQPMAWAMMLVSASMLAVPLALVAHRVPALVRLLTDLVP